MIIEGDGGTQTLNTKKSHSQAYMSGGAAQWCMKKDSKELGKRAPA